MPDPVIFPQSGTKNLATGFPCIPLTGGPVRRSYARSRYFFPQSGTKNLAIGLPRIPLAGEICQCVTGAAGPLTHPPPPPSNMRQILIIICKEAVWNFLNQSQDTPAKRLTL
jgi:hypothetical protein